MNILGFFKVKVIYLPPSAVQLFPVSPVVMFRTLANSWLVSVFSKDLDTMSWVQKNRI